MIVQAGDRWCNGIKCGPECTDWDYCVWDSSTSTEKCPSKCPSVSSSTPVCAYISCQYSNPTLPCKCGATNTANTPNVYCCASGNNGGGITASSKSICQANCGIASTPTPTLTSTPTPTLTPIVVCNSASYTSLASAFEFTSSVSAKYNMCGSEQYYKMIVPSGQKCDISWTVTPDSSSDYDLFVKWSVGSFPSKNSYDAKSTNSTGKTDSLSKTQLSGGIYYALVFKDSGTGKYTMSASMSNCASITPPPAPTLAFSANPVQVSSGSSATLTWSSTNASSCSASALPSNTQWSGTKDVSGSKTITNLTANITFTLVCTGTGGSITRSVTVSVSAVQTKQITVVSPNGGETWNPGDTRSITWTSTGINSVRIYLYNSMIYGSGSTIYITPNNNPVSASLGSYSWAIPNISSLPGQGGSVYKIRVEDVDDYLIDDYSDSYFSIIESSTTPVCDSVSYVSYDKAYDFGTSAGTKSNMCGKYQYYKVLVPSEKTCDIEWTLTSAKGSDYDLFIKKDGQPSSARSGYDYISECPGRNCVTKTDVDDVDKISKTDLSAGTYHALVKRAGGSGGYSIVVAVINCKTATQEPPVLTSGALIKLADDFRVYLVIGGKKLWIPSIKVFNAMKLDWTKIQTVGKEEFNKYSEVKLIRAQKGINVYLLVNGQFRRHVPTEAIFKSYGYKWEDIIEFEPTVVEAFPESQLLQLEGDYKVYKLEGIIKRWIKTAQSFEKLGFDWSMISIINKTEFDFYSTGNPIE